MGNISNTVVKAFPKELDPLAHFIGASSTRVVMSAEKDMGFHKPAPATLLQPTPGDPLIANNQMRIAALAAQRSGRASTILSQPSSDILGG